MAVSIVEDFAAIMVNFEKIVNSHFFFDRAGGIVKERQARLFSPQQNLWLQACANWVQQKKEEDPCSVYPQLAELDKALEGPKTAKYLSDVAAIHLQCIRMIQAARAMHDKGCTSDKVATLVTIGRDLLEVGSLPEGVSHDLEKSLRSWMAKPLDSLCICREVLDHISAYSEPNTETNQGKRHQRARHLRRPCWLCDLIGYFITGNWLAGIHKVRVPFILIDAIREGESQLAELDLQALSKGNGQVFIDPRQSFILFEDGFENIFDQTLEAAKCLMDEDDITRDIRITINFLHVDEGKNRCSYEELRRILAAPAGHSIVLAGRSATAATSMGLYCALTGKTADTRVIALAQTDKHGRLHEVGYIPGKVHAAVNSGLFDTIVVTNRQDQEKVYDVLEGSDFSVRVASTLQELVNASVIFGELPYPLARLYGDITKADHPKVRLRALCLAFSGLLKYIALMAISEYVARGYDNPSIDQLIADAILRVPSPRDWQAVLESILKFYKENRCQTGIPAMVAFYFQEEQEEIRNTENVTEIVRLVELCEEVIGANIIPEDPHEADEIFCEHKKRLDRLLTASSFIFDYKLMLDLRGHRLSCHGLELKMMGISDSENLHIDDFYWQAEGKEPISFLACLLYCVPQKSVNADLMIYRSRTSENVSYRRGDSVGLTAPDMFARGAARLIAIEEKLAQRHQEREEERKRKNVTRPDWGRLYDYCRQESHNLIKVHTGEKKYHPDFYAPRESIENLFWQFINGSEKFLILVGDSGSGKTNLICHLTEECTKAEQHNCVLHYQGRNYAEQRLVSQVAKDLVLEESQLIPYLEALNNSTQVKRGKKLILFFDAINEHQYPRKLYDEIRMLEQNLRNVISYHKIVISMRTATWDAFSRSFEVLQKDKAYFCTEVDGYRLPMVRIGQFTEEETAAAYNLYAINPNDPSQIAELKKNFGIKLETPYKDVPNSLRPLLANPIFLRYLSKTYTTVYSESGLHDPSRSLSELDILLDYYEHNLPESKHRVFLTHFLDLLWLKKGDSLTEGDLNTLARDEPRISKVCDIIREHFHEGDVDYVRERYVCLNANPKCDNWAREMHPDQVPTQVCPACGHKLVSQVTLVRSTLFFLIHEGIISRYERESAEHKTVTVLRFTYDRFFEVMMARHLMYLLERDHESEPITRTLGSWISATSESPIYDRVMSNLLVMLQNKRAVIDKTDVEGVKYELETDRLEHSFDRMLVKLAKEGSNRTAYIIHLALITLGYQQDKREDVAGCVQKISKHAAARFLSKEKRLKLAKLAAGIARDLDLEQVFVQLGQNSISSIRTIAACQTYILWRSDPQAGRSLMNRVQGQLFYPIIRIPRLRLLEFFVSSTTLLLMRHPSDSDSVDSIIDMLRSLVKRGFFWVRIAMLLLPRLAAEIFRDVPNDYNPVNLTELRLAKKDFKARPRLREAANQYLDFLNQSDPDWNRQKELIEIIQKESPNNNFCIVIHQLVQAYRAASDIDGAIQSEVDVGMKAAGHSDMWLQASVYDVVWLSSSTWQVSDESYRKMTELWTTMIDHNAFTHRALSEKAKYHQWALFYFGIVQAKRTESYFLEEMGRLFDTLYDRHRDDGLYAFCRGVEITGAMLGPMDRDLVLVSLATIGDLLNRYKVPEKKADRFFGNNRSDKYRRELSGENLRILIRTLARIRLLFREEVDHAIDSIRDYHQRQLVIALVNSEPYNEKVGTLLSQGGQDFFFYSMTMPYWRKFFVDILSHFINGPSLRSSISFMLKRLLETLLQYDPNKRLRR